MESSRGSRREHVGILSITGRTFGCRNAGFCLAGKRNLGNTMYIKAGTVKVEALRSSITRFLPIFTGVPTYLAQVYLQESPRTSIPTTAIHSSPHHRQRAQQRRCEVSMAIGIPRHKLDLGVFEHEKRLLALQSPSSHKITRPLLPSPSRSELLWSGPQWAPSEIYRTRVGEVKAVPFVCLSSMASGGAIRTLGRRLDSVVSRWLGHSAAISP